ncbi:MAG TPA: PAS domain S-box protein [Coriobacteriia bacterium]
MKVGPQSPLLTILERLPIAATICDVETGAILWTNRRSLTLAGATSPQQIVGRSLMELLEPDQHGVALRDIEAVVRGESPSPVVYRLRRMDGGTADVQIMSAPMRFQGKPAMLSLLADVTDRESLMRELADSEERYRVLVEDSPNGIVVSVGNTIVYVNPAMVAALGADGPEHLIGRSVLDFVEAGQHRAVRDARKRLYATGEAYTISPLTLVRPDGSMLHAASHTTRIHWQGEPAAQTIIQDPDRPDPI